MTDDNPVSVSEEMLIAGRKAAEQPIAEDDVGRVARVLYLRANSFDCWDQVGEELRAEYLDHARAAITALSAMNVDGMREALVNARFALEYWQREWAVHVQLYGPVKWADGPAERGNREIKCIAALETPAKEMGE